MMIHSPKLIKNVRRRMENTASAWSLRRKLFGYMLLLACLLILFLMTAFFLSGQYNTAEQEAYDALDMQMEVYEKYVLDHFDSIAAAGINLSKNVTSSLEGYLETNALSFANLTDNAEKIAELQQLFLESLIQQLNQENCSGVYIILDTTVNSRLEDAECSRACLYLQTNGYKSSYNPISMLYGNADIARANNMMPHRQWHLEFDTRIFPSYEEFKRRTDEPATATYRFTDLFVIPGTEMRVMLLCVPLVGENNRFYGICGFEISESYFMSYYAQPTKVDYLTYLFTPGVDSVIDTEAGFSCGESDGYYRIPSGTLTAEDLENGLYRYTGSALSYIGISRSISLSPNNPLYTLSVLMRKSDFDRDKTTESLKTLLIWILIVAAAVCLCFYFSRKFLIPLLKSIERIKANDSLDEQTSISEIDDLFAFLSEKDRQHSELVYTLSQEKQEMLAQHELLKSEHNAVTSEKEHLQTEYEKAQLELSRLAYSRKAEIDPDDYAHFLSGVKTLTLTERKVFDMYLAGMTVKEIAQASGIAESTVYYHNKNIYSKLGINSLKQLLRYAALMQQQEKEESLLQT